MNHMLEMFKMQYFMKFLGDSQGQGQGQGRNTMYYTMFTLMLYDHIARQFPQISALCILWLTALYNRYFGREQVGQSGQSQQSGHSGQSGQQDVQQKPPEKKPKAFIQYERSPDMKYSSTTIDAVIYHVCNLPEVKSLRFNGIEMVPNFTDMLMIDNDVWFEIQNSHSQTSQNFLMQMTNQEKQLESIVYKLTTFDHDIPWLHRFVERSIESYEQEKKNKLGNEAYYFDHMVTQGDSYNNPLLRSRVWFKKSKFSSNRTLKNVYLRQCDELTKRVEFFNRRRDWYDSKGIPHTLGIVMWGHPGCGKTSTIKAIANETKRHIFNIMLSEVKTKEALKDLFYNDTVHIYTGDKMETHHIPVNKRIYVIEDIDAMDSIVLKRTPEQLRKEEELRLKKEAEMELLKQKQGAEMFERMTAGNSQMMQDSLDLATLLNVLDGVRETPGRIIILSTNYPERLDEALLRPGRFDMMIEYEKHPVEVLIEHVEKYYDITLSAEQRGRLSVAALDKKWTPAEVSQILFKYIYSVDDAIHCLIDEHPESYFRFSRASAVCTVSADVETDAEAEAEAKATSLDDLYAQMDREQEQQQEQQQKEELQEVQEVQEVQEPSQEQKQEEQEEEHKEEQSHVPLVIVPRELPPGAPTPEDMSQYLNLLEQFQTRNEEFEKGFVSAFDASNAFNAFNAFQGSELD